MCLHVVVFQQQPLRLPSVQLTAYPDVAQYIHSCIPAFIQYGSKGTVGSVIEFSNSLFQNNSATAGKVAGRSGNNAAGGGVYITYQGHAFDTEVTATGSIWVGNSAKASTRDDTTHFSAGAGLRIMFLKDCHRSNSSFTRCAFSGNRIASGHTSSGGGLSHRVEGDAFGTRVSFVSSHFVANSVTTNLGTVAGGGRGAFAAGGFISYGKVRLPGHGLGEGVVGGYCVLENACCSSLNVWCVVWIAECPPKLSTILALQTPA